MVEFNLKLDRGIGEDIRVENGCGWTNLRRGHEQKK